MRLFSTMQERDRFFRSLDYGDLTVIPGSWFEHANTAPETLSGWVYNHLAVQHDCARIAVAEIEGVTGNRLNLDRLKESPVFNFCFGAMTVSPDGSIQPIVEKFLGVTLPSDTTNQVCGRMMAIFMNGSIPLIR